MGVGREVEVGREVGVGRDVGLGRRWEGGGV